MKLSIALLDDIILPFHKKFHEFSEELIIFQPDYSIFEGEEVSLIWYVALDETTKGQIWSSNSETTFTGIKGETEGLGQFSIKLTNHSGGLLLQFLSNIFRTNI